MPTHRLLVPLLLLLPVSLLAQPQPVGEPYDLAPAGSKLVQLVPDGAGGMLAGWIQRDGDDFQYVFQRFDADNNPVGDPLAPFEPEPTQPEAWANRLCQAGVDGTGQVVVAWRKEGLPIQFARYDLENNQIGEVVDVHAPTHTVIGLQLVADALGNFTIAWSESSELAPPSDSETAPVTLYFARFDASGQVLIAPGILADNLPWRAEQLGSVDGFAVAVNAHGEMAAAWNAFSDTEGYYILKGQRFDAEGLPLGPDFVVCPVIDYYGMPVSAGMAVSAAINNDGRVVFAWSHVYGPVAPEGYEAPAVIFCPIVAHRFNPAGESEGGPFYVGSDMYNHHMTGFGRPGVAMDEAGRFVITAGTRGFFCAYLPDGSPMSEFQWLPGGNPVYFSGVTPLFRSDTGAFTIGYNLADSDNPASVVVEALDFEWGTASDTFPVFPFPGGFQSDSLQPPSGGSGGCAPSQPPTAALLVLLAGLLALSTRSLRRRAT